jgi:hypothetical protein
MRDGGVMTGALAEEATMTAHEGRARRWRRLNWIGAVAISAPVTYAGLGFVLGTLENGARRGLPYLFQLELLTLAVFCSWPILLRHFSGASGQPIRVVGVLFAVAALLGMDVEAEYPINLWAWVIVGVVCGWTVILRVLRPEWMTARFVAGSVVFLAVLAVECWNAVSRSVYETYLGGDLGFRLALLFAFAAAPLMLRQTYQPRRGEAWGAVGFLLLCALVGQILCPS